MRVVHATSVSFQHRPSFCDNSSKHRSRRHEQRSGSTGSAVGVSGGSKVSYVTQPYLGLSNLVWVSEVTQMQSLGLGLVVNSLQQLGPQVSNPLTQQLVVVVIAVHDSGFDTIQSRDHVLETIEVIEVVVVRSCWESFQLTDDITPSYGSVVELQRFYQFLDH